ncbi:MAG: hypothetical protein ACLR1V_08540 [Coprococcus sp.]
MRVLNALKRLNEPASAAMVTQKGRGYVPGGEESFRLSRSGSLILPQVSPLAGKSVSYTSIFSNHTASSGKTHPDVVTTESSGRCWMVQT